MKKSKYSSNEWTWKPEVTTYPTSKEEVFNADVNKVVDWYRFLPPAKNDDEKYLLKLICKQFKKFKYQNDINNTQENKENNFKKKYIKTA